MASVEEPKGGVSAWIMLTLLFLAYVLSLFDRMVIALLVEPIKADLNISDTQIGLLQGLAFALLYCSLALPVGVLVDRSRRVTIVAWGVGLWSLMTSLCGLSTHYWQLFLGRIGVGVGEATLSPAAYSLIADAFPKRQLGIVTSIFAMGASLGASLTLMAGGSFVLALEQKGAIDLPLVGTLQPWQQAFGLAGIPGLAVAISIALLREPSRKGLGSDVTPDAREIIDFLKRGRGWIVPHFLSVGLSTMVLFGTTSWIIAFFARTPAWNVEQAGHAAGLANLIGAVVGLLIGGKVSDLVHDRGAHFRLYVCAIALAICSGAAAVYPLVASPNVAATVWGLVMATAAVPVGVAGANLQEATPGRMRGVVSAIYFFVITVIGIAAGPALIAIISDTFFPRPDGIRYALAIVGGVASALAAGGFCLAAHRQSNPTEIL